MTHHHFTLHPQLQQDTLLIADLPLCQLLLMNDSRYPWFILVPRRTNIKEIHHLEPLDHRQLWMESARISQILETEYHPDKLNVATLGNKVPQLHIHHIARFSDDAAWPDPVWGKLPPKPYSENDAKHAVSRLQAVLRHV